MFIVDEISGDIITLTQGDTGEYVLTGLPTDQYYTYHFAIQDENRNPIGEEIVVSGNLRSTVTFPIKASLTDLLKVKKNEEYATYYFGVKCCSAQAGIEDTLIIGNKQVGERNTITVYPKKVEGV